MISKLEKCFYQVEHVDSYKSYQLEHVSTYNLVIEVHILKICRAIILIGVYENYKIEGNEKRDNQKFLKIKNQAFYNREASRVCYFTKLW